MSPVSDQPQFSFNEVDIPLDSPQFIAFSPMWPSGAAARRRMVLASRRTVHIYGMPDTPLVGKAEGPSSLILESTLELEENSQVTALIFRDEDSARAVVIASSSSSGSGARPTKHLVQVWSCEQGSAPAQGSPLPAPPKAMDRGGHLVSLSDHGSEVTQLAVSNTYLLSADTSGECRVWQKNRSFASRATARLHQGAIIDLTVDRHFAYSLGNLEHTVEVWSLPDLKPVLSIVADDLQTCLSPNSSLTFMFPPDGQPINLASSPTDAGKMSCKLSRFTAVRRPASRWSGGSSRTSGNPRGMLFVAGALARGQDLAGEDAAVLMEWSLSGTPVCQSAIVAHDCPIVCIAYGPYDNGPVVTADCKGLCRVWDCTPRLICSQQIDTLRCPIVEGLEQKSEINVALASDPLQSSLYSITGDKRLFVWRQTRTTADPV